MACCHCLSDMHTSEACLENPTRALLSWSMPSFAPGTSMPPQPSWATNSNQMPRQSQPSGGAGGGKFRGLPPLQSQRRLPLRLQPLQVCSCVFELPGQSPEVGVRQCIGWCEVEGGSVREAASGGLIESQRSARTDSIACLLWYHSTIMIILCLVYYR